MNSAQGSGVFNFLPPWFGNAFSLGAQSSRPSDTVIIFDWDDTLLCSSAINLQQWNATQLQQLETTIESILNTSMSLGETLIVTNGNKSWVQDSARRFLPNLMPLLNRLRVMSARAVYEQTWPGEPFAWKKAAFSQILSERWHKHTSGLGSTPDYGDGVIRGVNLIVLGDSLAEIQAAQTATATIPGQSLVKTLKFKEMPSVNELLGQLRAATQLLQEIVNEDSSSRKALVPRSLPPHLNYLTSWASGWRITDHRIGYPLDTSSQSPLTLPLPVTHPVNSLIEPQSPVTLAGG